MAGGVLTDLCLGLTESVFNGFVQIKGKGGEVSSWEMFQQHSFLSAWIFVFFLLFLSSSLRLSPATPCLDLKTACAVALRCTPDSSIKP